jgi:signal transduction histidine kinase
VSVSGELLSGSDFTWAFAYVLLAAYFAVLAVRRPNEGVVYAVFSAGCIAIAGYSFCSAMHYRALDPLVAADWNRRAFVCAPPGSAMICHAVAIYGRLPPRARRWLFACTYVPAFAFTIAAASGLLFPPGTPTLITALDGTIRQRFTVVPALVAYEVWMAATMTWVLVTVVRAALAGAKEAMLASFGGLLLAACIVHDGLAVHGVLRSVILSEHGFSAFALGLSYTLLARHERVADELLAKGVELRRRARAIRRAYEELRAAQEELVRKEQLAVVGEIAAVVSHEVRNPLAIITNAVAGLRRETTSAEDRATLLTIVDEETERLNRLVGDLLRYARPFVVERRTLALDALVNRACEIAAAPPFGGHVTLQRPTFSVALPEVQGDADLLRQVLDNLVQNACQAMATGGTLTVRVEPKDEAGAAGVVIAIADTGEGMNTLVRSRARTPFFTTRPGGTGLGLAICDRIVKGHGGVLSIESRSGEGTEVRVWLPAGVIEGPSLLRTSNPPAEPLLMTSRGTPLPPSRPAPPSASSVRSASGGAERE